MGLPEFLTPETLTYIAIGIIVIGVIIGLVKKLLWIIVVSLVIGGSTLISQPVVAEPVKEFISDTFGGMFEPLKDNDYEDIKNELSDEIKN